MPSAVFPPRIVDDAPPDPRITLADILDWIGQARACVLAVDPHAQARVEFPFTFSVGIARGLPEVQACQARAHLERRQDDGSFLPLPLTKFAFVMARFDNHCLHADGLAPKGWAQEQLRTLTTTTLQDVGGSWEDGDWRLSAVHIAPVSRTAHWSNPAPGSLSSLVAAHLARLRSCHLQALDMEAAAPAPAAARILPRI